MGSASDDPGGVHEGNPAADAVHRCNIAALPSWAVFLLVSSQAFEPVQPPATVIHGMSKACPQRRKRARFKARQWCDAKAECGESQARCAPDAIADQEIHRALGTIRAVPHEVDRGLAPVRQVQEVGERGYLVSRANDRAVEVL